MAKAIIAKCHCIHVASPAIRVLPGPGRVDVQGDRLALVCDLPPPMLVGTCAEPLTNRNAISATRREHATQRASRARCSSQPLPCLVLGLSLFIQIQGYMSCFSCPRAVRDSLGSHGQYDTATERPVCCCSTSSDTPFERRQGSQRRSTPPSARGFRRSTFREDQDASEKCGIPAT